MTLELLVPLVLSWLLVGGLGIVIYALMRTHGEVLVSQGGLTEQLLAAETRVGLRAADDPPPASAVLPPGLAVGELAPDFALPDLTGRTRRLQDFRRPFVLVFFGASCSYCRAMAPRIGRLPVDALPVVVVGHGEPEELRRLAAEHDWQCDVLLDAPELDVFRAYKASATPTGYLVDEEGRIGTELAAGADAVLAAAGVPEERN